MEKIAIVGSGLMGSAMAWPLTDNGYEVNLVGTHLDDDIIHSCKQNRFHPHLKRQLPKNVTPFYLSELDDALIDVAFIVSGVNSNGVRWIGETLAPKVNRNTKIIAITKGLEATKKGELIILPDVMRAQFPAQIQDDVSIAAVGGPCIAGELAGRRQSCVYFGSRELKTVNTLRDYFRTDYYHVWTTNDIRSLELAVALKNAYALGVGVAAGMLQVAGGADPGGCIYAQPCCGFLCPRLQGNPQHACSPESKSGICLQLAWSRGPLCHISWWPISYAGPYNGDWPAI